MVTVTIPNLKKITIEKKLVLIPKREYEFLLRLKTRVVPEIKLTSVDKRAIAQSERELKRGDYLTLDELEHELESSRAKARK